MSVFLGSRARLFLSVSILVTVALAITSFFALIADVNAHQAKRLERRWEQSGSVAYASQLVSARESLEFAEQLSFDHPDYLQALGRLSSWHFFVEGEAVDEVQVRAGLSDFREALKVRPYWAYGWSELLLLHALLREVDTEFDRAFSAVLSTGPNEPRALLNLVNASLGSWSSLSGEQQDQARAAFARLLSLSNNQSRAAIAIATQHGMKTTVCSALDDKAIQTWVLRLCSSK